MENKNTNMDKTDSIVIKEAIWEVTKTVLNDEEVATQGRIKIRPFFTNTATVSVKAGATINLGNYESARVDIMLSVPCYFEEIDSVYTQVKEWTDSKLAKEYQELKQIISKK